MPILPRVSNLSGKPGHLPKHRTGGSAEAQVFHSIAAYQLSEAPLLVWPGAIAIAIVPYIVEFLWPSVYLFDASIILFATSLFALRYDGILTGLSSLNLLFIIINVVMILIYIRDWSSIVNLLSIFIAITSISISFCSGNYTNSAIVATFRLIFIATLFAAVGGTIFSILLSDVVGVYNPINTYMEIGRVLILVVKRDDITIYGGSALIYYSFVILLLSLSNVVEIHLRLRIVITALSILGLIFTGTAEALIAGGVVFMVFLIEYLPLSNLAKNFLHAILFLLLAATAIFPDLTQTAMSFVRFSLQNKSSDVYGDDLTSGRALLNLVYGEVIQRSPLIGLGHSDPTVQLGTAVVTGDMENHAAIESCLHTAAQYGVPYLLSAILVLISPLKLLRSQERSYRICGAGFSIGMVCFLSAGSIDTAHSSEFILFYSIATFLSNRLLRVKSD